MWISKIELTNFKSYQHADFDFPEPEEGRNIVVIGGMNGYGKTSVLEALYLCLYGADAMAHLARAGLKSDDVRGYPSFLERAFNGEAKRSGGDVMTVRVIINRSKTSGLDVRRRWYFRSNGGWHEEEAVVREIKRNTVGAPRTDGAAGFRLSELLDEHFVPAHIAPFFFFDGEEVKKLADQTRVEQIKQGLEGLLGVVLLRNLADRLRNFEATKRGAISTVDEDNIHALLDSLTSDESKLSVLEQEISSARDRLSTFKNERESLIERVTSAGGGGGDIATVKDLAEEREQVRGAVREVQRKLEKILAEKLPLNFVPNSLIAGFKAQLQREITFEVWENERRAVLPKRQKFEDAFFKDDLEAVEPRLTPQQISVIKDRIESAWEALFYPPPTGCDGVMHDYLQGGLRERALQFLTSISVGQQEIRDLLGEQRQLNDRVADLGRKIARVEGVDRDGTLNELKKSLAGLTQQIDTLEDEIRDQEREHAGLEVGVNNIRARYVQEKKRLDDTSPIRKMLNRSERVRSAIEDLVPSLFPLKVEALSRAMTRVYKQLAHKTQVDSIVIDNDGTAHILGKTGRELSFDRSAGENQIFATALIAGLAEVSGVKAPLVVDTPLGRLDSEHRKNIFRFWISNPKRQVILLSQDKEIDHEFYSEIYSNVAATYLLEHRDVGDGIGRTVAHRGEYFKANK